MAGDIQPKVVATNITFSLWISTSKKSYWCIASSDIDYQRILQSNWMRVFWPMTCEPGFFRIMGSDRKTEKCNVFHFRLLPAKSNDKTLWKVRKLPFRTPFVYFRANKNFSRKFTSATFLFLDFYCCAEFQKN